MVGTKAMLSPAMRQPRTSARMSSIRVTVCITALQKQCSGAGYSRDFTAAT